MKHTHKVRIFFVTEQLNQLQLSLKTKISEVEELNQKNEILRNHLTELETGLSTLKRKYLKEKEAKVESFQSVEVLIKYTVILLFDDGSFVKFKTL